MTHPYPSNINREQFELIPPILETARKKIKPGQVDLYEVFSGLLYLLNTGCQWSMLPKDFPKWLPYILIFKYGVKSKKMA
jgi:transposase